MQTSFSPQQLADPATATAASVIRKCVHCGFCIATCPTYVLLGDELDSPRGRIYLMKQMLENEQQPTAEVVKHIDRCLSCLSCMTTCPSGVNYMHLIDHARAYIEQRYRRPLADRAMRAMLAALLPYPARFRAALRLGRLVRGLAPLLHRVPALRPVAAMLTLAPPLPPRGAPIAPSPAGAPPDAPRRGRVVLMQGCAEPVLRPQIRAAATRLLNRAGYDVCFAASEGCCGALVHHLGRTADSLAAARRNVVAWERVLADGLEAIVITTSGCGTTVKDYGFMLREDPEFAARAARISDLARDISEVLEPMPAVPDSPSAGLVIGYHSACSMQHGQKITAAPQRLLTAAGFSVRMPADSHLCCGSAGTYNILQPDIAATLGDRKTACLERTGADVIATGNIGCATQIALRTGIPVVHTAQLLDWATGGPMPDELGPVVARGRGRTGQPHIGRSAPDPR